MTDRVTQPISEERQAIERAVGRLFPHDPVRVAALAALDSVLAALVAAEERNAELEKALHGRLLAEGRCPFCGWRTVVEGRGQVCGSCVRALASSSARAGGLTEPEGGDERSSPGCNATRLGIHPDSPAPTGSVSPSSGAAGSVPAREPE